MKKKIALAVMALVIVGAGVTIALRIASKNYMEDVRDNIDEVTTDKEVGACTLDDCEDDEESAHTAFGKAVTIEEVDAIFEEKDDAILMIGFGECPWCIDLAPVLSETVSELNLDDKAYYFNTRPDGVKENDYRYGSDPTYLKLYERLLPYLEEDEVVYAPTVAYIKDGEIKGIHVGTLEDHDAHKRDLTADETKTLKDLLKGEIHKYLEI